MAVAAPSAFAASPSTPYDLFQERSPDPQPTGRFGERHAAARADLDGDGVNDYFIGDLSETVNGVNNAGRVYAISGRTRRVIYIIPSPDIQADSQFGFFIQVLGDVSGDGKPDIAVGTQTQDTTPSGAPCTPSANGCNKDQGKVWVFSGRTGELLYAIIPPPDGQISGANFGSRLGNAGDITGDGVSELVAGATGVSGGRAYIFNGKTGAWVRTLAPPDPAPVFGPVFGLSVQGPGDVDGDGVTDQLVDAALGGPTGSGRLYLFSGKTGAVLSRIDDPSPQPGASFGFQDVAPLSPGDVNNDGRADLFANGFSQNGPAGDAQGRVWVFDGKASVATGNGVVLYEPKDPTPNKGGMFGFSMDRTDYNKDGRPDLYVGSSPHDISAQPCPVLPPSDPNDCGSDQSGGTYVFDGRDGSLLKSLELPAGVRQPGGAGNLGSNLGWSAIAPGDLNRDGEPDYVTGSTFFDRGDNKDEGASFAFLSRAAASGPGSAPPGSVPKGCNSAGVKVLGKTNSGGRVLQGSNGDDRICGTSRGDVITGNGGRDVITGGGGDDRINGGSGSDRINGGSGKDRISGSSGNDRISGGSGNDRINGNSGSDRINGNSGNDRLTGASGNDVISGSTGKDVISGGSGNDRLSGNSGNDRINGDSGNDRISGGSGNDRLKGGSGRDRISGGSGRDRISGGSGRNQIKQ
jgi:Ca2+-binding RTX toxin-like protein